MRWKILFWTPSSIQITGSVSRYISILNYFLTNLYYIINYSQIIDASTSRWEVPLNINPATGGNANTLYTVEFSDEPYFSFKVIRKSSGAVLFDSSAGKFTYADQYIGMTWTLPSENVYGIGENEQHSFKQYKQFKYIDSMFYVFVTVTDTTFLKERLGHCGVGISLPL